MNMAALILLAAELPAARARQTLALICADDSAGDAGQLVSEADAAWQRDMQPVASALAGALHAPDTVSALAGLKHLLPGLLREVNRASTLTAVLITGLGAALLDGYSEDVAGGQLITIPETPLVTANAAAPLASETLVTDALKQWRGRSVFETDFGSAELRGLSRGLANRSIFSARTTSAEYLSEVSHVVVHILNGAMNQATGRLRLLKKLAELGYDPAVGFPADMAAIPPAERGSLQDLSSTRRLDLVIETNVRMAQNFGRMLAGNRPYELREYPAWELARLFSREIPRGKKVVHGVISADPANAWEQRWADAAAAVDWDGVANAGFIARKDSPIWQALGEGEGGYTDTLRNPFPPFAFRSGMGWRPDKRTEAIRLQLVQPDEIPVPTTGTLAVGQQQIRDAVKNLSPEIRAELMRQLEELD